MNTPFENASCQLRTNTLKNFSGTGALNINIFSRRINLKRIEKGVRGHAPLEIFFEIYILYWPLKSSVQFSGKFCLNVLTPNLSALPNMTHIVRTFSIMRAEDVRLIVNEKAKIMKDLSLKHF